MYHSYVFYLRTEVPSYTLHVRTEYGSIILPEARKEVLSYFKYFTSFVLPEVLSYESTVLVYYCKTTYLPYFESTFVHTKIPCLGEGISFRKYFRKVLSKVHTTYESTFVLNKYCTCTTLYNSVHNVISCTRTVL